VLGVEHVNRLVALPPHTSWPILRFRRERGRLGFDERGWAIDGSYAHLPVGRESQALFDRGRRVVTVRSPAVVPEESLVHPILALAGGIFAHWDGREALHAGAFVGNDGAWILLGDNEAGKSSTLAQLALLGYPVLSDDLVVLQDMMAFAGPRCLDLRRATTSRLNLDELLEVRGNERYRLPLGEIVPEVPVHGWIFLAWGSRIELRELGPGDRVRRLTNKRMLIGRLPTRPDLFLDLARLRAWELVRPRRWDCLRPAVDSLLDLAF